jgi:signal transduction histidine kinase
MTNDDLKDVIRNISFEVKKIINISEFATKAKFRLITEDISVDLVNYISEYITNIIPGVTDKRVKIQFENLTETEIQKTIKPIELNILIDNIINNAGKAEAENLIIKLENKDNRLLVSFIDDGKGIEKKNISKIFDFGYTTTEGSGLGLYHVKQIVDEMKAGILVYNNKQKGVTFELIL